MPSYLRFLLTHARLLGFGFVLTLFSSFGQTFYIALSSEGIRVTFDLSHSGFGLLYSLATLASGLTIIYLGQRIDHVDLRKYIVAVCLGLIAACFLVAGSPSVLLLAVGIFLLRLCGQGLMGHVAMTSMARYFDIRRGTAISIAGLGYPTGEAVFPIVGVALIAGFGWRGSWLAVAIGLALILVPLVLWLLRGQERRHEEHLKMLRELKSQRATEGTHPSPAASHRQWTRSEVLRDWRLYCVLPAALAPAFVVTGLFFHQLHLVDSKGWAIAWFAACFIGFATAQVPSSLISGALIDAVGARRLLPFFLIPLWLALLTLVLFNHSAFALLFMVLAGMTSGMVGTILGALWAELYGIEHLGAIRALTTSLMVFSTSLSPFALGWLIDRQVSVEQIAGLCAAYVAVASIVAAVGVSAGPSRHNRWVET